MNTEVEKIILDQLKNISTQQCTANERLARLETKAEEREKRDITQDTTIEEMKKDIGIIKNKNSAFEGGKGAAALIGSYAVAIYSIFHK